MRNRGLEPRRLRWYFPGLATWGYHGPYRTGHGRFWGQRGGVTLNLYAGSPPATMAPLETPVAHPVCSMPRRSEMRDDSGFLENG